MKHLLDTHVVVRWLFDDRKLDKDHARIIARSLRRGAPVGVSALTLWEIAKLGEADRLDLDRNAAECLAEIESNSDLEILPLDARVALESTRLGSRFHGDPVDQLIAATARCHGLVLLTSDQRIIDSGVVTVA